MSGETILTVNGGSSTIKFSVYHVGESLSRGLTVNALIPAWGSPLRLACS